MRIFIKYDLNTMYQAVLTKTLDSLEIPYELEGLGVIHFKENNKQINIENLKLDFEKYGIEIVENPKNILTQKIKEAIIEIVFVHEDLPTSKISTYLAEKLHHSYGYLANIFSEVTYTSIENFIILQKIEFAKQIIMSNELTFTEISYKLNYSSVAHFSTQFKNVTGLTPSAFKRIMNKKLNIN